jgi:hypothetical protein
MRKRWLAMHGRTAIMKLATHRVRASADAMRIFLMDLQRMNSSIFLKTRSGALIDLRLYMQTYHRDILLVQRVARRYITINRARMELMKRKWVQVERQLEREARDKLAGGGNRSRSSALFSSPKKSVAGLGRRGRRRRAAVAASASDRRRLGPTSEDLRDLTVEELEDLLEERVEKNRSLCTSDALLGVGKEERDTKDIPVVKVCLNRVADTAKIKRLRSWLCRHIKRVRVFLRHQHEEDLITWKAQQMEVTASQMTQVMEDMFEEEEKREEAEEEGDDEEEDEEEEKKKRAADEDNIDAELWKNWSNVKLMLQRGKIDLNLHSSYGHDPRPMYPDVFLLTGPLWDESGFCQLVSEFQAETSE